MEDQIYQAAVGILYLSGFMLVLCGIAWLMDHVFHSSMERFETWLSGKDEDDNT